MGKSSSSPSPPKQPDAGENYESWIKSYSQYAGQRRKAELGDVETQLQIANKLAPAMLELQREYTPEMVRLERQLSPMIYDLQQSQRQREIQDVAELAPLLRQAVEDPQSYAIRQALGQQIEGELSRGASLDPGLAREIEQGIRAGQTARGMSRGTGAVSAEALMKGTQAEQLRRNRQNQAMAFLQNQATTQIDPWTAITGRQGVRQALSYGSPAMPQGYQGVGQMAPMAMQQNAQAAQMNNMLGYNYQTAQAGSQGWGTGETIGRVAAAPFTAGLSLFL